MSAIQIVLLIVAVYATWVQLFNFIQIHAVVTKYGAVEMTVALRAQLLFAPIPQILFILSLTLGW